MSEDKDMASGRAFVPAASSQQAVSPVPASIPDADSEIKRLKSLAADHFRNSSRLAKRLVAAEDELRRLKRKAPHSHGDTQ